MEPELKQLINLLSFTDEPVEFWHAGFRQDRLLTLAHQHRVLIPTIARWERLAASGRAPGVPLPFKRAATKERIQALKVAGWLGRLADALDSDGITWLALKGPALSRQIYGDPGQRTSRDLDILVNAIDVSAAVEAARSLHWQVPQDWQRVMDLTGKIDLELDSLTDEQPLLEIHRALAPDYASLNFGSLPELDSQAVQVGSRSVPTLAGADAVIFVAWHGAKHLWMRLNWLLDLAGLLTRQDLDLEQLVERGRRTGAERSLRAGIALCRQLLHLPIEGLPRGSPAVERAAERVAGWALERIPLGPQAGALGRRPWSYRWHFREARVNDCRGNAALRLRSLMAPVEPDVRWLGPQHDALLHFAARPFLLGRRIAMDAFSRPNKKKSA